MYTNLFHISKYISTTFNGRDLVEDHSEEHEREVDRLVEDRLEGDQMEEVH